MRDWFSKQCRVFAMWFLSKVGAEDVRVIPASSLMLMENRLAEVEAYVAKHSGRLNDGTTRTVRKKLRIGLQTCRSLLRAARATEHTARYLRSA